MASPRSSPSSCFRLVLNKTPSPLPLHLSSSAPPSPILLTTHQWSTNSHRLVPVPMASLAGPPLLAIAVLFYLHLALTTAASTPPSTLPRALAAGDKPEVILAGGAQAQRACTYTVQIKTSCSSPRSSPDAVSLAFGDVYKNEVYAATVSPARGFERCATDTFRVTGPCGYGVCYLYLRRTGRVGWTPQWVRVYEPTSSTFYFGDPLANGVWYGTDRCLRRAVAGGAGVSSSSSEHDDAGKTMLRGQSITGGGVPVAVM